MWSSELYILSSHLLRVAKHMGFVYNTDLIDLLMSVNEREKKLIEKKIIY